MAAAHPSRLSERQPSGAATARGFGRWQPPGRGAPRQLDEGHGRHPIQNIHEAQDDLDTPHTSNQTQVRGSPSEEGKTSQVFWHPRSTITSQVARMTAPLLLEDLLAK